MERSEPAFVPEWLKGSGGATASTNDQPVLSSSRSDENHISKQMRNKTSMSSDHDVGGRVISDRTASSYFRRSYSSIESAYARSNTSFDRSHRGRDWEKGLNGNQDKEKSILDEQRHRDYSDTLDNIFPSSFERDIFLRSQSMIAGKQGDTWPKKVLGYSPVDKKSNHRNGNGSLAGTVVISSKQNTSFERDFPSLGDEERQVGSEIGRVSSPGLSIAIQSLPVGTSAVIGGDGWTSALAEVPVAVGGNTMGVSSTHQTVPVSSAALGPSLTTGLNMAETLVQGPSRARTPPQLTVATQRLEELAIKQSRQLIPMTPTTPKILVSPAEKSKPKIGQQHLLHTVNQPRNLAKPDSPRTSNEGKLHVLKPSRELNGGLLSVKDSSGPKNGNKVLNTPAAAGSTTPLRSPNKNPKFNNAEHTEATFPIIVEKRPSSQAQSRNDFFNLLKKKSSTNSPSTGPVVLPSDSKKSDEFIIEEVGVIPLQGDVQSSETSLSNSSTDNICEVTRDGDCYDVFRGSYSNGEKHSSDDMIVYPDEEEAAFLRSLGWDENAGDDGGLTEEEISAFLKEYMKLMPSSKLGNGVRPTALHDSYNGSFDTGLDSSESESSDSDF